MRHVERRHVEAVEDRRQVFEQAVAQPAIERAEGLVEEEHTRLGSERPRERDALLLSTRERDDGPSFVPFEPDELEALAHASFDVAARITAHAETEGDVAPDVAMLEERVVLEDEPDPAAMRRHGGEVVALEEHAARVGAEQPCDDPQERALPGAARPEHGHGLAGGDLERDAVEGLRVAEVDADILDPEHQTKTSRGGRGACAR